MPELADVQRAMQAAILSYRPAGAAAALVAGDDRLGAADRLGIYARGYRMRLLECLRADFPALRLLVGDTAFDLFAEDYIAANPPRARSLYGFGAGFADHLAARQPPEAAAPGSLLAAPAQLARLERARSEAQRARGVERDAVPLGADLAFLPGARLRRPDSAFLLGLDFDFGALLAAAERGEPGGMPPAVPSLVAVARSGWRVRVHRLDAWRFAFLEALGPAGAEVQAAAAAAAAQSGRGTRALLADLAAWLPAAGAAGLAARAGPL
ncbi:MAG: putative DNA-binding domain-containing protein [Allosphingosinicella sp.]